MRILLLLACISISSMCFAQEAIPKNNPNISFSVLAIRANLIGEWYTNLSTYDGGTREEFASINSDGTFQFRFTDFDSSGALNSTAVVSGLWGVSEDKFFTIDTMYQRGDQPAFEKDLSDQKR